MIRTKEMYAYFEWMYDKVCGERFPDNVSYRRLFAFLHDTEFTYIIQRDANRVGDGIGLRYRFSYETGFPDDCLGGPCSVLEMMIALSLRIEEEYMDDLTVGNRTGQWFWEMINNLGLGYMDDMRFDERLANEITTRFLNREYEPCGKGGLFIVRHCREDLRDVEIWYQMTWYLNSIL